MAHTISAYGTEYKILQYYFQKSDFIAGSYSQHRGRFLHYWVSIYAQTPYHLSYINGFQINAKPH